MFVSTVHGVYSYDVSDPANPALLGALPMYIWENEDVDVDPVRKRLFISRDPRGFTSPATPGAAFPYGAVHIIDVSDPALMIQLNVFLLPAGHTTTCVNHCDTSGPPAPTPTRRPSRSSTAGRSSRTDVTDPPNPKPCPAPIDIDHNFGANDYVHDVQVDADGVAWVSGQGGVRGYWTSGEHHDPVSGRLRTATGCDPVPYAGAGTPKAATPSQFMHNAWRDVTRPTILLGTEENVVSDCATAGRFATYDLTPAPRRRGLPARDHGHRDDEGAGHLDARAASPAAPAAPRRTTSPARGDGITANAFYEQGVRFLDTSDPSDIRQVGYFVNDDSNTWAAYWHKGLVYVADFGRGVDVLRFDGAAGAADRDRAARCAPRTAALSFSAVGVRRALPAGRRRRLGGRRRACRRRASAAPSRPRRRAARRAAPARVELAGGHPHRVGQARPHGQRRRAGRSAARGRAVGGQLHRPALHRAGRGREVELQLAADAGGGQRGQPRRERPEEQPQAGARPRDPLEPLVARAAGEAAEQHRE